MDPPPTSTLRDPGTLFYQKDVIRRSIISAYWVAIILSLPLWWYFTSIKRLSLPSSRVQQLAQQHLTLPISICIEANAPLVDRVQDILTARISQEPQRWKGLAVRLEGRAHCGTLPSPKLQGLLHCQVQETRQKTKRIQLFQTMDLLTYKTGDCISHWMSQTVGLLSVLQKFINQFALCTSTVSARQHAILSPRPILKL